MGRLILGMMQSLDGYIAGRSGGPQPDGVLSSQAAEFPPPGITFRRFSAATTEAGIFSTHFSRHFRNTAEEG